MSRTNLRNLSLLPWLVLPVMLLRYWQLQDALPQRIAVHFSFNNVPNGWSDKGGFAFGFLGMTIGMLALFTVLSFIPKRPKSFAWVLMLIEYGVSAVMCLAFVGVLEFNALNRADVLRIAGRVAMLTPILAIVAVVMAIARSSRDEIRTVSSPEANVALAGSAISPSRGRLLAEETQRAPLAAMLFALLAVVFLGIAVKTPVSPTCLRVLMGFLAVLMVWVLWQAWGGFRYRVTSTGVEVRTGGIRLASISKANIQEYRVAHCDPLSEFGGWGIRFLPGKRAYIWHGHEAVRIRTPERTFFLGHDQPERLVKDLDVMMKSV